jgi:hypothetical protein
MAPRGRLYAAPLLQLSADNHIQPKCTTSRQVATHCLCRCRAKHPLQLQRATRARRGKPLSHRTLTLRLAPLCPHVSATIKGSLSLHLVRSATILLSAPVSVTIGFPLFCRHTSSLGHLTASRPPCVGLRAPLYPRDALGTTGPTPLSPEHHRVGVESPPRFPLGELLRRPHPIHLLCCRLPLMQPLS